MSSAPLTSAASQAAPQGPSRGPAGATWADDIGLTLSAYPVRRVLQTRVSDLDGYGHLNAIRLGHFYEDARAAFHVAAGREGGRVLVAQLTLRYLSEGRWPGEVEVGTGIVRVGRSSFVMGQGLSRTAGGSASAKLCLCTRSRDVRPPSPRDTARPCSSTASAIAGPDSHRARRLSQIR